MSPVPAGVDLPFLLEPPLGRFLRDEVAIQESDVSQFPVRSGDGVPAHAHGAATCLRDGACRWNSFWQLLKE